MDKEKLITRLNWFYSLELNQVDFYTSQSSSFNKRYSGLVFERVSYIEQQHVDNIAHMIKELGANPSPLGDVLSPLIGSIAGKIISLTGLEDVLKINIMIENKAMKDYKELINTLKQKEHGHSELIKQLEYNFIDENLHTEWFKNKLSQLQSDESSLIN
ncbi:demethoxyubiquinone hydroxylase family protein [Desulfosporosinus metallidurans]|uniref:Putative membrane protein n=1 Tax=Desulfosporosinus metallidurans TaxID=1888891 RepID=A0A1Q8QWW9_9FIRM|nr:ferritin-like domain-containing protein [Desulfosporosinus metallidurans]OLN31828.1 putative membrane protein [Desulfosporosinus metallidurans]